LEDPAAFSAKLLRKVLVLLNRFEAAENHHIRFISRFVAFFSIPFPSLGLVLPLGIAGMVMSLWRSPKARALALIFVAYGITLVAFFTNVRLRLPLLVILILFFVQRIFLLRSYVAGRQFRQV
jgi:uncharacterized SAM-binding protein YcdF (DUF218 family)